MLTDGQVEEIDFDLEAVRAAIAHADAKLNPDALLALSCATKLRAEVDRLRTGVAEALLLLDQLKTSAERNELWQSALAYRGAIGVVRMHLPTTAADAEPLEVVL